MIARIPDFNDLAGRKRPQRRFVVVDLVGKDPGVAETQAPVGVGNQPGDGAIRYALDVRCRRVP
jgi:hypothetical protein